MIRCALCEREFKDLIALYVHVRRSHKEVSLSDYHIKYIDSGEGFCKCGKEKKHISFFVGFEKTCGRDECRIKYEGLTEKKLIVNKKVKESLESNIKTITCTLCNKEFKFNKSFKVHLYHMHKEITIEQYYQTYINTDIPKCGCGKNKRFLLKSLDNPYAETCGDTSCKFGNERTEKTKQTSKEKYGKDFFTQTEEYRVSVKQTSLNNSNGKYDHHLKDPDLIKKREEKLLKEKGVKNIFQLEEVKIKIKKTTLKKYGDECYRNTEQARTTHLKNYNRKLGEFTTEQREKGNLIKRSKKYYEILNSEKYNIHVIPMFELNEYKGVYEEHLWKCLKCNNLFEDNLSNDKVPTCKICYPQLYGCSKGEKEVAEFLSQYTTVEENKRYYYSKKQFYEIDIFLPEYNLGIEFNGTLHHSENFGGKSKLYHLNKTKYMENIDCQLIHITDAEWYNKKELVRSMLLSKIGRNDIVIPARKCEIKIVSSQESNMFLSANHIQGSCTSKYRYGLYYNDELVSIITFGKSRYDKKYEYELLRFASKMNVTVIGGFSRLLKHFRINNKGTIISYANRRFSKGDIYYKNNFSFVKETAPSYSYFQKNKSTETFFNREKFMKHKLGKILKKFDPSITEWENMKNNDYDRIWDCGNLVFELK